jgi:hypothetical protein
MATHGLGPYPSMAADDHARWRVRLECERVGCTAHVMTVYEPALLEQTIVHGTDRYEVMSGPYAPKWQGVVGWLDTLHAPMVAARERERSSYPDASLT